MGFISCSLGNYSGVCSEPFSPSAHFSFRRLNTLNKCASMKLDVNLPKKKVSVDSITRFIIKMMLLQSLTFIGLVDYCMKIPKLKRNYFLNIGDSLGHLF